MNYKKKLIEVALPLETINRESAREKSIRHGHPSTLHLWWARRPLAAARAVIWASLVDDPSSHPDKFPTEEAQDAERERLFDILRELVVWENSNNQDVLNRAKAEIMSSTDGNPPELLDPFAGGGAIPLEAQRLGLKAHASDLNPVAVMINKAMIEIPPRFANLSPVNPEARRQMGSGKGDISWEGAAGLAEDVRYYGEWMKKEAFKRIGHLYPTVTDENGEERTVIAWIWARTVKCPNPACGIEMPLIKSFTLSKKKGRETYAKPIINNTVTYDIIEGKNAPDGTVTRQGASCICCGTTVSFPYIREESTKERMSAHLVAIVAEGNSQRLFMKATAEHINAANVQRPANYPSGALSGKALVNVGLYGFDETSKLFTNRQLTVLTTFSDLVKEAQQLAAKHAVEAGMVTEDQPLSEGGSGAKAYGKAIGSYLAFIVSKLSDRGSSICSWDSSRDGLRNTFGRQALPMVWDYAEGNPFSNSSGCWDNMTDWVVKVIANLPATGHGNAKQFDAQSDNGMRNIMVSTDPPYYDNIGYADLSDFFYIWMRQSLQETYPKLFRTMLVPKAEELVATPYRFGGSVQKARDFFEDGMLKTFQQIFIYAREDVPVTVYYAYKQSEEEGESGSASTGWETMLSAIIQAGFTITGTWPMRTELANRMISYESNALASSIVLACRKRSDNAPLGTRSDFISTLRRELRPALTKLQSVNIAPVDLAQSIIGPGMAVYSRYSQVLEADGSPMGVRAALQIINQELDSYFTEQEGELDRDSRFCVDLYNQYAFNEMKYGEAEVLATAKGTSIGGMVGRGLLFAQKGVVRLLTREELPEMIDADESNIWLLTQQLTRAMETGGTEQTARLLKDRYGGAVEAAKSLCYRLHAIAERKRWAREALAYNALITSWQDAQSRAAQLQAAEPVQTRMDI
jgi:putative DNA methylase